MKLKRKHIITISNNNYFFVGTEKDNSFKVEDNTTTNATISTAEFNYYCHDYHHRYYCKSITTNITMIIMMIIFIITTRKRRKSRRRRTY